MYDSKNNRFICRKVKNPPEQMIFTDFNIENESDKAYLISIVLDKETGVFYSGWFPKSQVRVEIEKRPNGDRKLYVPEWLWNKKQEEK